MRLFVGFLFHIGQRGIVRNGRRIFLQQIPHNSHCLPRLFRRGPVFPDKRPLALAYLMQEGRRVKWISPVDLPDSAILFSRQRIEMLQRKSKKHPPAHAVKLLHQAAPFAPRIVKYNRFLRRPPKRDKRQRIFAVIRGHCFIFPQLLRALCPTGEPQLRPRCQEAIHIL